MILNTPALTSMAPYTHQSPVHLQSQLTVIQDLAAVVTQGVVGGQVTSRLITEQAKITQRKALADNDDLDDNLSHDDDTAASKKKQKPKTSSNKTSRFAPEKQAPARRDPKPENDEGSDGNEQLKIKKAIRKKSRIAIRAEGPADFEDEEEHLEMSSLEPSPGHEELEPRKQTSKNPAARVSKA
jgi:hypothetical protein